MQEERVLALESLRATAEDLLPYDPADIYASTPHSHPPPSSVTALW